MSSSRHVFPWTPEPLGLLSIAFPFAAVVMRAKLQCRVRRVPARGCGHVCGTSGSRGARGEGESSNSGLFVSARQDNSGLQIFLPVHVAPEVWTAGLERSWPVDLNLLARGLTLTGQPVGSRRIVPWELIFPVVRGGLKCMLQSEHRNGTIGTIWTSGVGTGNESTTHGVQWSLSALGLKLELFGRRSIAWLLQVLLNS